MRLKPSSHSLKFQRFGVTQEFSTAVRLPINNGEQITRSQGLYPLARLLVREMRNKPQHWPRGGGLFLQRVQDGALCEQRINLEDFTSYWLTHPGVPCHRLIN